MGILDPFRRTSNKRPVIGSAGGVIPGGAPTTPDAIMRRTEDWQKRVLAMAGSVGEAKHAGRFVSNTTKKIRLVVTHEGVEVPILSEQLNELSMGRACMNLHYVGEVVLAYKYEGGRTRWACYGKRDFKQDGKKPLEVKGEDGKFRALDSGWKWFRVWRPDPSDMYAADSSYKAQLDTLEALYVHQLADAAIATSRLAGAGILYIPNDEFSDIPMVDGGEPEVGSQQHFEQRLRGAMTDSLRNRNAQDAFVPLTMFGSSEFADGIRHVLMERVDDAKGFNERMKGYAEKFGRGVDLPAEVITGMGETNHWAAWKVDQNTWSYYLEPLVEVPRDAILKNFIAPVALLLGFTGKVTIEIDATEVIVKPDRTDAALRAFGMGALSGEGLLFYAGFDPQYLHPFANDPKGAAATQPDGAPRMPSANFRGSEGQPVGDRNFQR